ncbi:MAG: oligosaccharide flippase family protein [Acidimicrobiales bacterium]
MRRDGCPHAVADHGQTRPPAHGCLAERGPVVGLRLPKPQREPDQSAPLRGRTIRGGSYLAGREAAGMLVRLGGVLVVVRAIGPSEYGIYVAASAFVAFIVALAQLGAEVYLVRLSVEPDDQLYDSVSGCLLISSLLATVLSFAVSFAAGAWISDATALWVFRVLVLGVPITVLAVAPQASIERSFGYRRIGVLEVGSDAILYLTSVPLALAGAGPWSLVAGWLACRVWVLVAGYVLAGMRPGFRWSRATAGSLVHHGLTFSAWEWLHRIAALANPLIVGPYVGTAGIGYVALAARLVDTLGFAIRGVRRLGIVSLARVRGDDGRLRRAVEDSTAFYLIALALPLAVFATVAREVVPAVFGPPWQEAIPVFVLLALSRVLDSGATLQSALLLSRGRNATLVAVSMMRNAILFGAAIILVPWLGVVGYGIATLLTVACAVPTDLVARRIVPFGYRKVLPGAVALVPVLLFPVVPLPFSFALLLPAPAVMVIPKSRAVLFDIARSVWHSLRQSAPPA